MNLAWEGAHQDREVLHASYAEMKRLLDTAEGEPLILGNEFSDVEVRKVRTRNGVRLLIRAPKSEQWVTLDPLELEALTWQTTATFSAMVGNPYRPLFPNGPS